MFRTACDDDGTGKFSQSGQCGDECRVDGDGGRRGAERHGGDAVHVDIEEVEAVEAADPRENEVLRVHDSLEELAAIDPRLVQVVEMRYFAGMTVTEIAGVLNLAERTVARDWEKARLFLHACLR